MTIPVPGAPLPTSSTGNYNDIPLSTSTTPGTNSGSSIWNLDVPTGAQVYTGINPPTTADGDVVHQKGVRTATYQSNNYVSADDFMSGLVKMSQTDPGSFQQVQRQMWEAGYYGSEAWKDVRQGTWSPDTSTAVKKAIEAYADVAIKAGVPTTFTDFLSQNAGNAEAGGNVDGTAGGTPPNTQVQLTDPVALKQAATQAAQQALGRNLTDAQLNAFVDSFHAQQTQSQQTSQLAAESNTNSVTTTPDASAQATQFAEQQNPDEFAKYQTSAYTNIFANMFLPSGSSAANITPVAGN